MNLFETMQNTACKKMLFFDEPAVALQAIVAINNTTLGPAICSCKMFDYASCQDAISEALKMAAYNTYRAALTRRSVGGGSVILLGKPETVKSEIYFRALGTFIDKLKGEVYLTEDSGVDGRDLLDIRRETKYVLGLPETYASSGDSTSNAASGVLWGIKAALKDLLNDTHLENVKVAVQGVGRVGSSIVTQLIAAGAEVIISDLAYDKIKNVQDRHPEVKAVKFDKLWSVECDVFCPCAFNHLLTRDQIELLKCKVIAGATSFILESVELLPHLAQRSITLLPGFLINCGELIQVSNELIGYGQDKTAGEVKDIYYTTLNILQAAAESKQSVTEIALRRAREYIKDVSLVKMLQ